MVILAFILSNIAQITSLCLSYSLSYVPKVTLFEVNIISLVSVAVFYPKLSFLP